MNTVQSNKVELEPVKVQYGQTLLVIFINYTSCACMNSVESNKSELELGEVQYAQTSLVIFILYIQKQVGYKRQK